MTTMNTLLTRVGSQVDPNFREDTSTAIAGFSLTDAKLANTVQGSLWEFGYIVRTAKDGADRYRGVESYTAGAGRFTLDGIAYADTATAAVAYQAWSRWSPSEVITVANRVLERLEMQEELDTLTLISGQRQYALTSSAAWLLRERQWIGAYLRSGTTAGAYTWSPIDGARLTFDEDVATLDFTRTIPGASDTVRLVAWRPYSSLSTLSLVADTTICPLEWLAAETIYEMYLLEYQRSPIEGRDSLQAALAIWSQRVSQERTAEVKHVHAPSGFVSSDDSGWGVPSPTWSWR